MKNGEICNNNKWDIGFDLHYTKKAVISIKFRKQPLLSKNYSVYASAEPIKKVAAKATMAYNSGNTANINVLPNTL